jgi:predicted esterase
VSDIPFGQSVSEDVTQYRIRENTRQLQELLRWRSEVDQSNAAQKVTIENMAAAVEALAETVDGLRKVIIGFAFSIAGSAIVFALAILAATGKI